MPGMAVEQLVRIPLGVSPRVAAPRALECTLGHCVPSSPDAMTAGTRSVCAPVRPLRQDQPVVWWALVSAVFVSAGTGLQAVTALRDLRAKRETLLAGLAVQDLHEEFAWWRNPIKRVRQEWLIRTLKRESPDEAAAYLHLRQVLWGWSLMLTGSVAALVSLAL